MKKYWGWWLGIFLVLAVVISFLVPDPAERSNTLGGLVMAAVISLFFIFKTLGEEWSGIISEIKTEKKYEADDDGGGEIYEVNYAYIKLDKGKNKKIKSQKGWKVGDKLEKKRGEVGIRVMVG